MATLYLSGAMGKNQLLMTFPEEGYLTSSGAPLHEVFQLQDRQFSMVGEARPDGSLDSATPVYRAFGANASGSTGHGGGFTGGQAGSGGLVFLRNRYYDPNSGQFTQEDPIGMAGGMNLYAYAGGDPVRYSDPMGLAGCPWHDVACWEDEAWAASGGTGFSGRVLAPLASTVLEITGATAVDSHAKEAAGGSAGAMGMLAFDLAINAVPGGGEGKAALSALMKDAAQNPSAWRVVGAFTEAAARKGLEGGTSIQKVIENQVGDRLVEHTLLDRSGNVVEQHYRPMYKARDVDK